MKSVVKIIFCFMLGLCYFVRVTNARGVIPSICLQPPPKSEGVCTIEIEGFYFDPHAMECLMYVVGGCRSTPGQSFGTVADCIATCIHGTRRLQDIQVNE